MKLKASAMLYHELRCAKLAAAVAKPVAAVLKLKQ
jgi:hypothetical protein